VEVQKPEAVKSDLPVVLRPMQEEHIPAVMAIERRSFPSPWPESAYRYELRHSAHSQFYVLQLRQGQEDSSTWRDRLWGVLQREEKPSILGYVGLRFRNDDAHVSNIAIHPDWRGLGLGEYLLLEAMDKGIRHGARRITLEVRASNEVARQLYRKVGFRRIGVRRDYYQDGEDAVLMALGPLDAETVRRVRELDRAAQTRLVEVDIPQGGASGSR